jgi:uncharacterized membrane protein YdjX (TVP38/TMEM64 family)
MASLPTAKGRVLGLLLLLLIVTLLASSDQVHAWLLEVLAWAESIMRARPALGRVIFVVLAAAAAMLAFVSSAILVPVAVFVWGKATSLMLLWLGWILGGICAYTMSRYLGRPAVRALSSHSSLEWYENLLSKRTPFGLVLLLQLALPSELPGYLLGVVRYPFAKYLAALALAELPYAVVTIYLGDSLIERRMYRLVLVAVGVAAFSGWTLYLLRRRVGSLRLP